MTQSVSFLFIISNMVITTTVTQALEKSIEEFRGES